MRTMLPLLLLIAACGGGGGGCAPDAGGYVFCQYQSALRIVPGFVLNVDCDGSMIAVDDYGFEATGPSVRDWTDFHTFGPEEPGTGCLVLPPSSLLGREVYDYSAGEFVLIATDDDLTAFLNR